MYCHYYKWNSVYHAILMNTFLIDNYFPRRIIMATGCYRSNHIVSTIDVECERFLIIPSIISNAQVLLT